jgi:very-short-patch-repair endonuclease
MPLIRRPPTLPVSFRKLLRLQHGVFTPAQAARHGLNSDVVRAQVAGRRWRRAEGGVIVAHTAGLGPTAFMWAALLRCGVGAALSHQTAGHILGLWPEVPNKVHIAIPAHRRVRPPPGVVVHRTRRQLVVEGDQPRAPVIETLFDLADECTDAGQVVALVTRALQRRDLDRGAVMTALASRPRARWRGLLTDLLRADAAGIESVLEWRFHGDVVERHGLPVPQRQHVVSSARRDALFSAFGVVIELDGRLGHVGEGAFRDMRRDNAAVGRGEVVLRYGWADVAGRPCMVAAEIAATLRRQGWNGRGRPCSPGCRVR